MMYTWKENVWHWKVEECKMLIGLDKYRTMLTEKIPTISTSIIISGSEGIGKFTLTLEVVKSMMSNEENIHVVKPEEGKSQISVEQIRDIFPIINIRPFNDNRHIIIIDEADKLNDVSFNLLLKRLEEPKSSELFILVTSKLDAIVDTIKSRCLNINMSLDYNEMQSYISKIEDTDISAVLSRLGFNHVISYIESDAVKSRYEDAKRTAKEALSITSKKQIATISQKLMKDLDISMEMLLQLSETEIVRNTYDMVKRDIMNKQILVEIMLYTLSEGNTLH